MAGRRHGLRRGFFLALLAMLLTGCGPAYVVFHPAGPVATRELHLIVLSAIIMAVVIAVVVALWVYVLARFRDTPGNHAPYLPNWRGSRRLEILVFALPAAIIIIVAIPTVKDTYALAHIPSRNPLVINVTSLDYKWLFQYPEQHVATVNYFYMPTDRPVLFQLTANSPFGAFWAPNLGGMEYTMPNRVLPLWLEATRTGTFLGRNANFSGLDFWRMTFRVHAVKASAFKGWIRHVKATAPPMTVDDYHHLLRQDVVRAQTYSTYPKNTFPERFREFTVKGLHYVPTRHP